MKKIPKKRDVVHACTYVPHDLATTIIVVALQMPTSTAHQTHHILELLGNY